MSSSLHEVVLHCGTKSCETWQLDILEFNVCTANPVTLQNWCWKRECENQVSMYYIIWTSKNLPNLEPIWAAISIP